MKNYVYAYKQRKSLFTLMDIISTPRSFIGMSTSSVVFRKTGRLGIFCWPVYWFESRCFPIHHGGLHCYHRESLQVTKESQGSRWIWSDFEQHQKRVRIGEEGFRHHLNRLKLLDPCDCSKYSCSYGKLLRWTRGGVCMVCRLCFAGKFLCESCPLHLFNSKGEDIGWRNCIYLFVLYRSFFFSCRAGKICNTYAIKEKSNQNYAH